MGTLGPDRHVSVLMTLSDLERRERGHFHKNLHNYGRTVFTLYIKRTLHGNRYGSLGGLFLEGQPAVAAHILEFLYIMPTPFDKERQSSAK